MGWMQEWERSFRQKANAVTAEFSPEVFALVTKQDGEYFGKVVVWRADDWTRTFFTRKMPFLKVMEGHRDWRFRMEMPVRLPDPKVVEDARLDSVFKRLDADLHIVLSVFDEMNKELSTTAYRPDIYADFTPLLSERCNIEYQGDKFIVASLRHGNPGWIYYWYRIVEFPSGTVLREDRVDFLTEAVDAIQEFVRHQVVPVYIDATLLFTPDKPSRCQAGLCLAPFPWRIPFDAA